MKILGYNTVVFDLDDTIWSGSEPDLWAKKLMPPLYHDNKKNRVYDYIGKYLQLHEGIYTVLDKLNNVNKNIGYSTVGGWGGTPYDWQPCTVVLRMLSMEKFFKHMRVIQYRTGNKVKNFVPIGKTLFIDDNEKHLKDIKEAFPEVTVLNRNQFERWEDLL